MEENPPFFSLLRLYPLVITLNTAPPCILVPQESTKNAFILIIFSNRLKILYQSDLSSFGCQAHQAGADCHIAGCMDIQAQNYRHPGKLNGKH